MGLGGCGNLERGFTNDIRGKVPVPQQKKGRGFQKTKFTSKGCGYGNGSSKSRKEKTKINIVGGLGAKLEAGTIKGGLSERARIKRERNGKIYKARPENLYNQTTIYKSIPKTTTPILKKILWHQQNNDRLDKSRFGLETWILENIPRKLRKQNQIWGNF